MFYIRLCDIIKEKKTTPTAIVLKIGLSKGNLASWRNGSSPSGDILAKLADELDCSVDYLLGRTDNPEVNK